METKQPIGKTLLLHGGILLGAIVLGFVLMLAAYALPTGRMRANVTKSLDMLEKEGDYPVWAENIYMAKLDQFTDAIMIKTAVMESDMGLVERALLNPFLNVEEDSGIPQTSNIRAELEGNYSQDEVMNYSRYWHGYLAILKPLLLIFNISEIRVMSMILQALLLLWALWLIKERLNGYYTLAFFAAVLLLSPISVALCMQYKNTYYIALISTITLLLLDKRGIGNRWSPVFMAGGIAVAFFDLLSAPLITLTIPLAVFMALRAKRGKLGWKETLLPCVSWGIGYGVMWFGEWVLATLLTKENVIKDGIERTLMRSAGDVEGAKVSFISVVKANLAAFNSPVFFLAILAGGIALAVFLVRSRGKLQWQKSLLWFFFAMALPFLWYFVVKNHSYIHTLFSYRLLAGGLLAGLCFIGALADHHGLSEARRAQ